LFGSTPSAGIGGVSFTTFAQFIKLAQMVEHQFAETAAAKLRTHLHAFDFAIVGA
jgi:hypothetical protein